MCARKLLMGLPGFCEASLVSECKCLHVIGCRQGQQHHLWLAAWDLFLAGCSSRCSSRSRHQNQKGRVHHSRLRHSGPASRSRPAICTPLHLPPQLPCGLLHQPDARWSPCRDQESAMHCRERMVTTCQRPSCQGCFPSTGLKLKFT